MRATAALLTAEAHVATTCALEGLFGIGVVRRDLITDFATWGMDDTMERLTKHSDTYMAAAARRLLFLVNDGLEVGSALFPCLILRCRGVALSPPMG
jgi:hypothetical protein